MIFIKTNDAHRNKKSSSLDVFIHESFVEFIPQTVIDESCVLVVRLSPGAVLEYNIIIPSLLNLHIRLPISSILFFQERVSGKDVLHPYLLLLITFLHFFFSILLSFLSLDFI